MMAKGLYLCEIIFSDGVLVSHKVLHIITMITASSYGA